MAKARQNMNDPEKTTVSKASFIKLSGIGPELARFLVEFIESPEIFFSLSHEKRCEIENQMDAILSSFGQREFNHPGDLSLAGRHCCRKAH